MDFVTHLHKTKQGYDALLVMVDYLTKMLILWPTHSTATAVDTARIFVDSVVRSHGLPRVIISDRDTRFTSTFWREVFKIMGLRWQCHQVFIRRWMGRLRGPTDP